MREFGRTLEAPDLGYKVAILCPDTHIVYDGRTPYERGIGGGISTRIRVARALARAGHQVTAIVNCARRQRIEGVDYVPLREADRVEADVAVLTTSGGALDLSPIHQLQVHAGLRILWVHGTSIPTGLDKIEFETVYAVSNFIRRAIIETWGLPARSVYVSYNGFEEEPFEAAEREGFVRDPHRLVYFSHPSKGLDSALAIVRRLRKHDQRYHLHLYGGPQLWGEAGVPAIAEDGVIDHGLVGQGDLFPELLKCSFSLHLQSRLEPGALVIGEAMRAGCVLVASPVGCFPEMIRSGWNGFLIEEDPASVEAHASAEALILNLTESPEAAESVRRRAMRAPWTISRMAQSWVDHWDWWFGRVGALRQSALSQRAHACPECANPMEVFADGFHCMNCGFYGHPFVEPVLASVEVPG